MADFRRTAVTLFHGVASHPSMVRSLLAAALLATAAPLAAQVHTSPLVDPKVAALRDKAMDGDSYAWDIVEGLTTEVGPRLAGTEAEVRARDWAVRKLKTALHLA